MKTLSVTVGKTINIGNYQSQKVEITLEAEGNEKAEDLYRAAKAFVEKKEKEKEILNIA